MRILRGANCENQAFVPGPHIGVDERVIKLWAEKTTRDARRYAAGLRRVVSECAGTAGVDYIRGYLEERSDEAI